jgi:SAM-dependent methyltransferase
MLGPVQNPRSWLGQIFGTGGGSLAYRTNRRSIWKGNIPEKYARLVNLVPGERILELGSAEGVLSLLLAQKKQKVIALEMKSDRHAEALRLKSFWQERGREVGRCEMVLGNIKDELHLLRRVDTVLAVRSIYYLRDDLSDVFDAVGREVPNVVLCGNENRARKYYQSKGELDDRLGKLNYFATLEGMTSLLQERGYTIVDVVAEGDPIVVGAKKIAASGAASGQDNRPM